MRPSKLTTLNLAGLLLGLLASLSMNLWLLQRARHYARLMHLTSLDPIGTRGYQAGAGPAEALATPAAAPQTRRVVFFGDSRARQWPAPGGAFHFVNRGVSGQTSLQALTRFEAHVPALAPDVVVIQVGANDLAAIALLPGSREQIVADCKANIAQIVERSRALGAMVILTTIIPIGDVTPGQRLFWSPEVRAALAEVNAFLAGLAAEGVVVLDTAPPLTRANGHVAAAYQADSLHLNPEGYAVLNRELMALLGENLRPPLPQSGRGGMEG